MTTPSWWHPRLELPGSDIRKLLIPKYTKLVLIVDYHLVWNYVRSFPYKKIYIYIYIEVFSNISHYYYVTGTWQHALWWLFNCLRLPQDTSHNHRQKQWGLSGRVEDRISVSIYIYIYIFLFFEIFHLRWSEVIVLDPPPPIFQTEQSP